jgi:hypothetical protein
MSDIRVNAYVLAADPSFLEASILAYYDRVDRIVVSFDDSHRSWTGTALPVEQCRSLISALDRDGKCREVAGRFFRPEHDPLENDTFQRQTALDAASDGADWVVQLDTDEVMLNSARFFDTLRRADGIGAGALDYPSRWVYTRVAPGRYLQKTSRFWRVAAAYPGPLAVRAGTTLRLARQTDAPPYRVDFRERNTDPWGPRRRLADEVVATSEAVIHFSWVRDPEVMRRKLGWSGHAGDLTDPSTLRAWKWRTRHPLLTTLGTPLRRDDWLRPVRITEPPGGAPPQITLDPPQS